MKPKVNINTQTIIKKGCERPKKWNRKEYSIIYKNKTFNCYLNTRDLVLFLNSDKNELLMSIRQCKKNKLCCKVSYGKWLVFSEQKQKPIYVYLPTELQIDHILPFSYIRLNMKNCRLSNKYYNFISNLRIMLGEENRRKSNYICLTKEECEEQIDICNQMKKKFNDKHLCDEIEKLKIENN